MVMCRTFGLISSVGRDPDLKAGVAGSYPASGAIFPP